MFYLVRDHPDAGVLSDFGRFDVVPGHDVDEKVKLVVLGDGHGDVVPLQSSPLVILGVDPGPHGQLVDEHLASLTQEK